MAQSQKKTLILGHRGSGAGREENTLPAFSEALKLGAAGIELDIWKCKSGEFIVRHNPKINGSVSIVHHSLAEIREASKVSILLLSDVLTDLSPCVVNIEIKNADSGISGSSAPGIVNSLGELVAEYADKFSFVFSTFDRELAVYFENLKGLGRTALLVGMRARISNPIVFCEQHNLASLHLHWRSFTHRTKKLLLQSNLEYSLWTVNSPSAISANMHTGAKFLITDNVSVAVDIAKRTTIAM